MTGPAQRLLVGRAGAAHRPPVGGWHWAAWSCEVAGTAILVLGGLSAVCLDFGAGSAVAAALPDAALRRLVTGLLFAGTGSLVAVSPLGRRSGAHINPVVTLAFWTQGKVHRDDVAGYLVSQFLGAVLGAALLLACWGTTARSVQLGVTQPGDGTSVAAAIGIEAVMTALLVGMLLGFTSSPHLARYTPLANWLLVAVLVLVGAPYTGTSLNPARSFGPAAVAPLFHDFGVYVAGPLLGAALAVAVFALFRERVVLTARLFHDERYPTALGTALPAPVG